MWGSDRDALKQGLTGPDAPQESSPGPSRCPGHHHFLLLTHCPWPGLLSTPLFVSGPEGMS